MSELISGKEALIALANGEEVEMMDNEVGMPWSIISKEKYDFKNPSPCMWMFLNQPSEIKFRLKPRTIKINVVEVPAPFEPKEGEECFVLANFLPQGYMGFKYPTFEDHVFQFGAWRTEEEIKQVVAALRSVFSESS